MTDIKRALQDAIQALKPSSESARLDAEILLSQCIHKNRTFLYSYPETLLSSEQLQNFAHLLKQRQEGWPIAYLVGQREFWSLPLQVNEATLIPRPETELLVELALHLLQDLPLAHVLELGTGSGAIALACASEKPQWRIKACDVSMAALEIAKENARRLKLNHVQFFQSDWFANLDSEERFDAILANPPYIAAKDPHLQKGDVRFEPGLALVSGEEGLDAIRFIVQNSLAWLKPNGLLLFEHGFAQKSAVRSMLMDYGYRDVQCWQDTQGQDRVSGGRI